MPVSDGEGGGGVVSAPGSLSGSRAGFCAGGCWVAARCGPDEWEICVQAPDLATWHEGEAWYPVCFRDSSEIRLPEAQPDLDRPAGPELEAQ